METIVNQGSFFLNDKKNFLQITRKIFQTAKIFKLDIIGLVWFVSVPKTKKSNSICKGYDQIGTKVAKQF